MNRLSVGRAALALVLFVFIASSSAAPVTSQCYGTPANGRIEHAVALPPSGANFFSYSTDPLLAGRTYVHGRVADIVVQAYAAAAHASPDSVFVYGETGLAAGGPFPPHRTHQNGLSVDFFVPVRDRGGKPTRLPSTRDNHFGYDIEFDKAGRFDAYQIDFEALAEHLYQLHKLARRQDAGLARVIVEPDYLPRLFATRRGAYLRSHIRFMKSKPWVRHDDHYHVDFAVPCKL